MDSAKALSKLHTNKIPTSMGQYSMEECAALFHQEDNPDWNPVTYNQILDNQKTDPQLKKLLQLSNCCLTQNIFHRGRKPYQLWTFKGKIYIPLKLQHKVVNWYHN